MSATRAALGREAVAAPRCEDGIENERHVRMRPRDRGYGAHVLSGAEHPDP